jgi:hypothetical protein
MALFPILVCIIAGVTLCSILLGWTEEICQWMGKRSWQFSLRELLLVMTIVAAVLGALEALFHRINSTS